ncbi:non-hydrolyzing UDP-N-acetylglucosamine 2-epimerase [Sedimenticola sp.]|uniref:non-hydrolyzing UDP-N-acetylglucosamine 2-epimerase n=1 Tax=Sedimenticola sp. TaxID=1940285 RepID=UPI003D0CA5BB
MKIATVLGARPQFIKAATVSRAIAHHNRLHPKRSIAEIIIHTGQHFDAAMSQVFFQELDIPQPKYNLGIASLGHGAMTGRMLEGLEALFRDENPDLVLVYGDTNSTLAGALAAVKMKLPIAHVEAGLRSHNPAMPEEINRVLTDRISQMLFCPTSLAVRNLESEGFPFPHTGANLQAILNVGDVMYDATLFYRQLARDSFSLSQWGVEEKQYVLCTIHRAENTDHSPRLESVLTALKEISRKIEVVLPLHPRTRKLVDQSGLQHGLSGIKILEPLSYLEMQRLEMGASAILTDSGGVQKEAYFHRVPCITLRDETEWLETVDMGWNQVAGAETENILSAFAGATLPDGPEESPYGLGDAAKKIVQFISENG